MIEGRGKQRRGTVLGGVIVVSKHPEESPEPLDVEELSVLGDWSEQAGGVFLQQLMFGDDPHPSLGA